MTVKLIFFLIKAMLTKAGGFDSKDQFISRLSDIIVDTCSEAQKKVKEKGLGKKEESLASLEIFLPGPVSKNVSLFCANLKTKLGEKLVNIDLNKIKTNLLKKKDEKNILVNQDLKLIGLKDLAGTGIGISRILANHPKYKDEFKDGLYAVGIITGGGFGSVNIKLKGKNVDIETSESSHNLAFDEEKGIVQLRDLGSNTKSIIRKYAEKIGIASEDLAPVLATGDARIASQEVIKLDTNKDEDAIKTLLKTGVYNVKDADDKNTWLEVDKNNSESVERFNKGRSSSINSYAEAMAQHSVQKINEGANLFIITGPLGLGLNKTISDNKKEFAGVESLQDLINNKIDKYIKKDETTRNLMKMNNFRVICSNDIKLENNTFGAEALLDERAEIAGGGEKGDWVRIPIEAFKENI